MRHSMVLAFFVGAMVLSAAAADIPPGSYQQTCRDIKLRGDSLRAKCETTRYQWVRTQLDDVDRCVGDITNIDGQLTCNKSSVPPQGTYLETCKNVRVRYNTLWARCKNMNGQWVDTSLNDFNRCHDGIGMPMVSCGVGLTGPEAVMTIGTGTAATRRADPTPRPAAIFA